MSEDWELNFFSSGEWQVIEERLDDLDEKGILYNPKREDIFNCLDNLPLLDVRAVFVGQDPYPDRTFATGTAFSIPPGIKEFPQSLQIIFAELCRDYPKIPFPKTGYLEAWWKEGVLLLNAIPTCQTGKSLSHDWLEWEFFTKEVLEKCDKGIPFVFMGGIARRFVKYIHNSPVLEVSHPSPRALLSAKVPFLGSGLFSWVNTYTTINWRL